MPSKPIPERPEYLRIAVYVANKQVEGKIASIPELAKHLGVTIPNLSMKLANVCGGESAQFNLFTKEDAPAPSKRRQGRLPQSLKVNWAGWGDAFKLYLQDQHRITFGEECPAIPLDSQKFLAPIIKNRFLHIAYIYDVATWRDVDNDNPIPMGNWIAHQLQSASINTFFESLCIRINTELKEYKTKVHSDPDICTLHIFCEFALTLPQRMADTGSENIFGGPNDKA